MAEDTDSLTLQILREMRAEQGAFHAEMRSFREETQERLETLEMQMQGVSGMLTLIYGKLMDHDERIAAIEALPRP